MQVKQQHNTIHTRNDLELGSWQSLVEVPGGFRGAHHIVSALHNGHGQVGQLVCMVDELILFLFVGFGGGGGR